MGKALVLAVLLFAAGFQGEYTILFTQNHGETYDIWGRDLTGFLEFSRLLEDEGFTITAINSGELAPGDLEGVDAVIVSYPVQNFTPAELDALDDYVNGGGSLVVFGGLDAINQTNPLISRYGMNITRRLLEVNGDKYITIDLPPEKSHPIFTYVETFEQIDTPAVRVFQEPYELIYPRDQAFEIKQGEGLIIIRDVGEGRVLVTGDADFLNNVFLDNHDNAQLGVNIVSYMTGRPIEKINRGGGTFWPYATGAVLVLAALWSIMRWKRRR